jgi:AT-rich interactive domain-containing protein 4B
VDAPHEPEDGPDARDERREEAAKDQENLDNHRDEEPFES